MDRQRTRACAKQAKYNNGVGWEEHSPAATKAQEGSGGRRKRRAKSKAKRSLLQKARTTARCRTQAQANA
jgi:hypothetical protein